MNQKKTWIALALFALLVVTMVPRRNSSSALTPNMNGPLANVAFAGPGPQPTYASPAEHNSPAGEFFVSDPVVADVSPALNSLPLVEAKPFTEAIVKGEPHQTNSFFNGDERPQIADPVAQEAFGLPGLDVMAAPAPIQNFNGMGNLAGVLPPDTDGEVGPNHFVQMVNSHLQIFNKSGQSLYGPVQINAIFAGFGGQCDTQNDGDPVVLYDQLADRWLISQFVASAPYGECIAISTTPDPTGTYYRYFFQLSTTVFHDYPHLGMWPDGYYMETNRFTGNTYTGPAVTVFDRAKMLTGQAATFQQFTLSSSYGTLLPADMDGPTAPPAGAPNYFAEISSTALRLWKFKVNWTTPSASTFTGPTSLTVASYNKLCSTTRNCVAQPGTTVKLDGLGDRLMFRLAYRNLNGTEVLLATHNVNAATSGTKAGVRWYEVRNPNGTPSIYQQGTYSPDTNNRWLGSIAMDKNGNIMLGYSTSGTSVYPSIRYAGRLSTDALGTLAQGEGTLIAGSGSQTHTASRWGDYAHMSVDPNDDCTFWFTTEYMPSTGSAPWQTRIGSFKFPSCTAGSPTATPTNTSVPPTATNVPPTATNVPPTATNVPPTATNVPPTVTGVPPTATNVPPTATNVPPTATPGGNIIVNPGFENGTTGWTQYSSGGYQLIDGTRPHAGAYSVYTCGYNSCNEYIEQTVTVPSNGTLTYWWYMTSSEGTTTAYDYLYVRVYSTSGTLLGTVRTWSNKNTRNVWAMDTLSLSAYAGQTVKLRFAATTDTSVLSAFFVDDVTLQ